MSIKNKLSKKKPNNSEQVMRLMVITIVASLISGTFVYYLMAQKLSDIEVKKSVSDISYAYMTHCFAKTNPESGWSYPEDNVVDLAKNSPGISSVKIVKKDGIRYIDFKANYASIKDMVTTYDSSTESFSLRLDCPR